MHFWGYLQWCITQLLFRLFTASPALPLRGQHRGFPLQSGSPWAAVHGQAALVAGSFAAWWFIQIVRNGVFTNRHKG
jgi:hypothetical protein